MAFYTFRDLSRDYMGRNYPEPKNFSVEDITAGAIQRIADAVERIADTLYASSPEGIADKKNEEDWEELLSVAEDVGRKIELRFKKNFPAWLKTSHAAYRSITKPAWIATLCESADELRALSFEDIVRLSCERRRKTTAEKIRRAVDEMLDAERNAAQPREEAAMPPET